MKSVFTHTLISLAILGMTTNVYARGGVVSRVTTGATESAATAAETGAAATERTTEIPHAPASTSSWLDHLAGAFVGFEGLDMRNMTNEDYYTAAPRATPDFFITHHIPTTYEWAWRVYGGINLTQCDDITLSWMQIRFRNIVGNLFPPGIPSLPLWSVEADWETIDGRLNIELDDIYAVWGHTIAFDNPWQIRWAAGVEYARLNDKLTVVESIPTTDFNTFGFEGKSRINGMGPRLELDATYRIPCSCNFALFAKANAALLASKRVIELQNINLNPEVVVADSIYANQYTVIPRLAMRFGGSYSHVFGQVGAAGLPCCRLTSFTLELGWMAETWIHAIERPLNSNLSAGFDNTYVENFNDQGFFVGLKINSDWL